MTAIEQTENGSSVSSLCNAMNLSRATFYRRRQNRSLENSLSKQQNAEGKSAVNMSPLDKRDNRQLTSHRALSKAERQSVLDSLHSERFVDQSPSEVYAALLDDGIYYCSIRTMYRILADNKEVRERRNQLRHPKYTKPELLATKPNEVWSWDITKLRGPAKWNHYHLYVILDIFSRLVVGWMVATRESKSLASRLISETCAKQSIAGGELTLHADRGASMKSKVVALLLSDLGVTKTHSRPHVSNDNPFSESQFKTMKYRPEFPDRFGSIQDARAFCGRFFDWYNTEHYHSGVGLLTPSAVHYGEAAGIIESRQDVLSAAWTLHPERFVGGAPSPPVLPDAVWINPPQEVVTNETKRANAL